MKKIICIGELSLNIVLDADGNTLGAMPGGCIARAAAMLADRGFSVFMASDAATDAVGDIAVAAVSSAGTDIRSVDRFTEGRTPVNIISTAGRYITRYEQYPEESFDVIWPRLDEGDIVVYGGFYALDGRMRPRIAKLLAYAVERKAVMVCLPGFMPQQMPRITRVMPEILENIENASVVVTRSSDLLTIFGEKDAGLCYDNRIDFYCRSLVNIDADNGSLQYFSGKEQTSAELPAQACTGMVAEAGIIAGIVAAIAGAGCEAARFAEAVDEHMRDTVLRSAVCTATEATAALTSWQHFV